MLAIRRGVCSAVNSVNTSARLLATSSPHRTPVKNEEQFSFLPGAPDRLALEAKLQEYEGRVQDVPVCIGDEEFRIGKPQHQVAPFDHQRKVATFYQADSNLIQKAIDVSQKAFKAWSETSLTERIDIFSKAADLLAGKYRMDVLAATMLGQGKTIVQAEIDATCELIDFLRFNSGFAQDLAQYSPIDTPGVTNTLHLRPVEGFWAAVSPFNFTAIGGNLCSAPAIMGNVVLWKPASTAMLSNYLVYRIYREAGLPAGVMNFMPSSGPVFGEAITGSPHLAGINFTGSVPTFNWIWRSVGANLEQYRAYPRLIGECGGKNFHLVHPSADVSHVVHCTLRAAFEYSGQKCSACARMYVPQSLWPQIKEQLIYEQSQIKLGSPLEGDTFLTAVIDHKSFNNIKGYVEHAKSSPNCTIIAGGKCDDSKGYYIDPTIIETTDPRDKLMQEEIFGPVLTVYVYPDAKFEDMFELVNTTTIFALTGAIFAKDPKVVEAAKKALWHAAGNFYVNDKCTGSVVGQQPFGGARMSGTNDKAGGPHYMMKFVSPMAVKTNTNKQEHWSYPYMGLN